MENRVVIASAGSRKTTFIVEESLKNADKIILILTYTIENLKQLHKYIVEKSGSVPSNVKIQSWYSFLLSEGVRPYQNYLYDDDRIPAIHFQTGRSARYIKKNNTKRYYLTKSKKIYTDKISEFACECDSLSNGLVIERIECIYDQIFIDEIQDLAGYDFDVLELLLNSNVLITVVGDSRQATYFTNCSPKNCNFKGKSIINLFEDWEKKGLCKITQKNECYRCNQSICEFSDKLYPEMPKTKSMNIKNTGHDGVFIIIEKDLAKYFDKYAPQILRDTKRVDTAGLPAVNLGLSKGQNFDRVMIIPNGPVKEYLKKGDPTKLKDITRAKLYVGLTRARYSVAFLYDGKTCFDEITKHEF